MLPACRTAWDTAEPGKLRPPTLTVCILILAFALLFVQGAWLLLPLLLVELVNIELSLLLGLEYNISAFNWLLKLFINI